MRHANYRGGDGHGIVLASDGFQPEVYRGTTWYSDYLEYGKNLYKEVVAADVVLGHTRKATSGGVNEAATHPIVYKNITLVHNGSLNDWERLLPYGIAQPVSDSAAIAWMLSHWGAKKTFETVTGATTCMWIDNDNNTVNIHKHADRHLWWCHVINPNQNNKVKGMFISSEPWMLIAALDKNGYKFTEPKSFVNGEHISFDIKTLEQTVDKYKHAVKDNWWDNYYQDYSSLPKPPKKKASFYDELGVNSNTLISSQIFQIERYPTDISGSMTGILESRASSVSEDISPVDVRCYTAYKTILDAFSDDSDDIGEWCQLGGNPAGTIQVNSKSVSFSKGLVMGAKTLVPVFDWGLVSSSPERVTIAHKIIKAIRAHHTFYNNSLIEKVYLQTTIEQWLEECESLLADVETGTLAYTMHIDNEWYPMKKSYFIASLRTV